MLTGDESGSICIRLLHPRHLTNSSRQGGRGGEEEEEDTVYRNQGVGAVDVNVADSLGLGRLEADRGGGGVAKVLEGAHAGGVLAISHVKGSLRLSLSADEGRAGGRWASLFVSGGKGEEKERKQGARRVEREEDGSYVCVGSACHGRDAGVVPAEQATVSSLMSNV